MINNKGGNNRASREHNNLKCIMMIKSDMLGLNVVNDFLKISILNWIRVRMNVFLLRKIKVILKTEHIENWTDRTTDKQYLSLYVSQILPTEQIEKVKVSPKQVTLKKTRKIRNKFQLLSEVRKWKTFPLYSKFNRSQTEIIQPLGIAKKSRIAVLAPILMGLPQEKSFLFTIFGASMYRRRIRSVGWHRRQDRSNGTTKLCHDRVKWTRVKH